MGIKLGNLNISDIYLGNTKIVSVYQGNTLIWGGDIPDDPSFYVTSDEPFTVRLTLFGAKSFVGNPQYLDPADNTWKDVELGIDYTYSANTKVHFRGTTNRWSYGINDYLYFSMGCTFKSVGGNILSLVNYNNNLNDSSFIRLFDSNQYIEDASQLNLQDIVDVPKNCFRNCFSECHNLKYACSLPNAGTIYGSSGNEEGGYRSMFYHCYSLENIPLVKAMMVQYYGCRTMFTQCSGIKISATQSEEYPYPYKIPSGVDYSSFMNMFYSTGGTFTGTPDRGATYYTSNEVIQ